MRLLAVLLLLLLPSSLDYNPWFSLSPFDGVVTLSVTDYRYPAYHHVPLDSLTDSVTDIGQLPLS